MSSSSNSRWMMALGLWGVVVTLGYQFLSLMKEVPVVVTVKAGRGEMEAYDDGYNLIDVVAPSSTGPMLKVLSYVATRSVLSPWILRHLLNKNGAPLVREFAAEFCHNLHPAAFPINRPTQTQTQLAQEWTKANPNILHNGFDLHPEQQQQQQQQRLRTVTDYHRLYLSQQATPSQVMERWLQGSRHLSHLRIFASNINENDIQAQAKASDERYASNRSLSVWDGVPVAIKDQSAIKGHPICSGSSVCTDPQEDDDTPARRLRQAGAILVGTTVMTEGGVTPLGYNALFDGPFNPYSVDHYSGGSSSGSAVAVASGLVPMAVGWDGGGSIRVPASMSGVVGLAVTFGRIAFESSSRVNSNIKAGPLAATVTDAALSYLLLSQLDPDAFYTELMGATNIPLPHLAGVVEGDTVVAPSRSSSTSPLQGVRLGVFWDHFHHTDEEVQRKCSEAVSFLEAKGAEVVNITIPHLREIHLSHGFKILSEFGYNWQSRFFNTSYVMEGNTEITVMLGRSLTATETLAADKIRSFGSKYIREQIFKILRIDAIVSPMIGTKVPRLPLDCRGYGESNTPLVYQVMRFVPLANFLGLPAMSMPIGYEDDTGLPIGFQLLGDAWEETKLIQIASVLEIYQERTAPKPENYFDVLYPWLS